MPHLPQRAAALPLKPIPAPAQRFETALIPRSGADDSLASIHWTVFSALVPAAAVGVFYFGPPALEVLLLSIVGCVAFEALFSHRRPRRPEAVSAGRAALTGLLLGMSLPPAAPAWMVVVGCAATLLLKNLVFWALGFNPLNPVLVAWVFLLILFPEQMTTWTPPSGLFTSIPDAVTAATPLGEVRMMLLARGAAQPVGGMSLTDGLIGRLPGSSGETSAITFALGGAFLLQRRVISWHIPASFLGSIAALAAAASAFDSARFPGAGFHLVTGGLVLGALFLATDYATAPAAPCGMLVYGTGCGALTWLIRSFGVYPEGVAFAILAMNMFTPLIDLYTRRNRSEEERGLP